MPTAKPPLLRLFQESKSSYSGYIAIIIVCILSGVLQTIATILFGRIVDYGIAGQFDALFLLVPPLVIVLLLNYIRIMINWALSGITFEKMFKIIRVRIYEALTRGKMPNFEKDMHTGDLSSRINSEVVTLCQTTSGGFTWFARVGFEGAVAVIGCLWLSWQLSLVYFFILPISTYLFVKISKPMELRQKQLSGNLGKATSIAADAINNIEINKTFMLEQEMDSRYAQEVDNSVSQSIESDKIAAKLSALKYFTTMVQLVALFGVAAFLVSRGYATVGTVIAFITLSAYIRTLLELSDYFVGTFRRAKALSERLYEILDIPLESGGESKAIESNAPVVSFENVSFSYEQEDTNNHFVLSNFNMQLERGKMAAIIGPTGAGKSTVIKLICKFYAPTSGCLKLFGTDVEEWSHASLRQHIAIVTQDASLFEGTVLENVRQGNPDASEVEVIAALESAQISIDIHTQVGEFGNNLSDGQKQRISIARAIIKQSELILLDEPTSALDNVSERELQKALNTLLENKTALVIAHRLSTIQNADYIYCLDASGKVIEQGSPAELMKAKGYYYEALGKQVIL